MTHVADKINITPIAITDDLTTLADYVRSSEGRSAIERGLSDIREGRTLTGKDVLISELTRRATIRRRT